MTDRIDHYMLVCEGTASDLTNKVNELVGKGYRPHGSAHVAAAGLLVFTQAMVRFTTRQSTNHGRKTIKER